MQTQQRPHGNGNHEGVGKGVSRMLWKDWLMSARTHRTPHSLELLACCAFRFGKSNQRGRFISSHGFDRAEPIPNAACPLIPLGAKIRHRLFWRHTMPSIMLLVSPSCGACPSAKSLWKQLRVKYSFSYREVDITTPDGAELANRHSVRAVPATIIDGRLTFVGVPSRESAEKALLLKMKPRE